jgi:putative hydrolase of the HAD superfamily
MAGVKKPNPIIFEYALDLETKQKEKNSIMIGILWGRYSGALDIGLDAIFFNERNSEAADIK